MDNQTYEYCKEKFKSLSYVYFEMTAAERLSESGKIVLNLIKDYGKKLKEFEKSVGMFYRNSQVGNYKQKLNPESPDDRNTTE